MACHVAPSSCKDEEHLHYTIFIGQHKAYIPLSLLWQHGHRSSFVTGQPKPTLDWGSSWWPQICMPRCMHHPPVPLQSQGRGQTGVGGEVQDMVVSCTTLQICSDSCQLLCILLSTACVQSVKSSKSIRPIPSYCHAIGHFLYTWPTQGMCHAFLKQAQIRYQYRIIYWVAKQEGNVQTDVNSIAGAHCIPCQTGPSSPACWQRAQSGCQTCCPAFPLPSDGSCLVLQAYLHTCKI